MEKVEHSNFIKTTKNGGIEFQFSIFNLKFSIDETLVFFIVLLAAVLRLYRIEDYMTFLGDEGRDVLVAYNILHGQPTLLGPTASVGGFFLGPIYYYFMVPFLLLFNYNPVGPAVMVGIFGVATVWLIYKVGSEFLGLSAGLMAAFLYSISPLVISHSRSSWNPNLMPFFSLLVLYVVYKALTKSKTKLFIFCGFLLGILMQFHYLAIFLGVIIGIYTVLIRILFYEGYFLKEKTWRILKDYFYILLGFIIGWSPFLVFEVRHGFPNTQSIISFIFHSGDTGTNIRFFETLYNVFFRLFARLVTRFPPPEQVSIAADPSITIWHNATLILAIASILLLSYKLIKNFKNQEQFQKLSLLFLWLILGVGLFGFYKKPIYDYYFGFMFPLPFVLVGNTLVVLYTNLHKSSRIRTIGKILAVAIFLILVWINLRGVPFRFVPNRQLAQVEGISKFVIDKTENKPFNFALITGGNSDHAYRYFFTLWQQEPRVIQNEKIDPKRETVTNQLLVVCEINPTSCYPLGNPLWEIAGFGRAEIVSEWNVSVVKVYKLRHLE